MTREQFCKYKFRAYMQIDYKPPRMEESVRCMLVAVDFDNEIMTLSSTEIDCENDNFIVNIKYCFLPRFIIKK